MPVLRLGDNLARKRPVRVEQLQTRTCAVRVAEISHSCNAIFPVRQRYLAA